MGFFQSPFDKAVAPVPSGEPSGSGDTQGGFMDLPGDPEKETPNAVSGLPLQMTTFHLEGQTTPTDGQVEMPPVASPGTFKIDAPKE